MKKKINNIVWVGIVFAILFFASCSNNASPSQDNPSQADDSGRVIASYSSGSCSYNFKDNSTVVVHASYEDNSDPQIRVLYDYDQSVGTYTGNPEQDGNVVITTTKVAGMSSGGLNPNVISRAATASAAVQEKINTAKTNEMDYVVITNEEIPLEEVVTPQSVTITISDDFFEVEDEVFGKTILPSKKIIASFKELGSSDNDRFYFYNDNTFVFHNCYTHIWTNSNTIVMWDYDRVIGTYSGDPTKDGTITFTFSKAVNEGKSSDVEKITQAVEAGSSYVSITNAEMVLESASYGSVQYTISNGTINLESDALWIRVPAGL
ncbi:MAG: hypothetical protein J6Y16_05215 [Treponema sp.]|nr:hypothetical protein [Treponema sp.]